MRTLTAMFDSRADAETARDRLAATGISNDDVTILDQGSIGGAAGHETHAHRSLWAEFKALFRDDEHSYAEGLRRGGYLLTARVDDAAVDRAVDILDDEGTVDLDQRTETWRSEGWTGGSAAGAAGAGLGIDRGVDDRRNDLSTGRSRVQDDADGSLSRPPVGNRETIRGGVRVRSYIVDEPSRDDVRRRDDRADSTPMGADYRDNDPTRSR